MKATARPNICIAKLLSQLCRGHAASSVKPLQRAQANVASVVVPPAETLVTGAGEVADKMNKADKAACGATARALAHRLTEAGIHDVHLHGKWRYHGRYRTFVDTLRDVGKGTLNVK
jgi:hypothetical protein